MKGGVNVAYVSVSMGLTSQGEVLNSSYWTSAPCDGAMTWAQFANGNITPTEGTSNYSELEFGDTTNGLILDSNSNLHLYYNGVDSASYGLATGATYPVQYILFFGIDEENHLGSFWIAQRRQVDRWGYSIAGGRLEAGQNTTKFYNTLDGYNWIKGIMPAQAIISNGGGATHIAKVTGQLKDLSSNLSDILIVSGGGGGGMLIDGTIYTGKDAGGISGNGTNSADQTSGYAFGQGEFSSNVSGGGGGLYGGYKGIVV